jgi:uncharacterized protein YyaL (SSP411 family)
MPNRLADAPSAYLRGAAGQPVDWYPWGDEPFEAARRSDRPVLLDIGAAWCHWCHVMDRESYESAALAERLNRDFVCIKVDRDERPEVDARYQAAIQALAGQGGWPLTGFLTPEGELFWGGTYFPPHDRYGAPGFGTVLDAVLDAWRGRRDEVRRQAHAVRERLAGFLAESRAAEPGEALLDDAVAEALRSFDARHGGFGRAPKFPHAGLLRLLLARWQDRGDPALRTAVERTLRGMARGGIHDQLGGGFHRYSVDESWVVPHFEKMLSENAELLRAYAEAAAALDDAECRAAAAGIVRWVREVMADPDGGYAASQDADVGHDDDGDYWTWTRDEAAAALDAGELEVAAAHWDLGTAGEMRHDPARNVLFVAADVESIARRTGRPLAETAALLDSAREKLRAARARRPAPFVDRTRYTAWNAMMAGALLRAAAVLDDAWARGHALLTLERIRAEAAEPDAGDGDALRHAPGGVAGLLDDQVQTAAAAVDAYEATGDGAWLAWAERLLERVWRDYLDRDGGGLVDRTSASGPGLLDAALKPLQDAPTPSPNGVAAETCLRLAELAADGGSRERSRERGAALVRAFAGQAPDLGVHAAAYLLAVDRLLHPPTHLVVAAGTDEVQADAFHRAALAHPAPRRVLRRLAQAAALDAAATLPDVVRAQLRAARDAGGGAGGDSRAYLCVGASCLPPADALEAWRETLAQAARPAAATGEP